MVEHDWIFHIKIKLLSLDWIKPKAIKSSFLIDYVWAITLSQTVKREEGKRNQTKHPFIISKSLISQVSSLKLKIIIMKFQLLFHMKDLKTFEARVPRSANQTYCLLSDTCLTSDWTIQITGPWWSETTYEVFSIAVNSR